MKTVKKTVKKYQAGGSTGKKLYSLDGEKAFYRHIEGPKGYDKVIKYTGDSKRPYTMTVKKGGKTNSFQLTKDQAERQKSIADREGRPLKMKKGGITKKSK
jgi:hypothetical protein